MEVLNLKNWVIIYSLILFPKDIYLFSTTVPVKFFYWNIFEIIFHKIFVENFNILLSVLLPISIFSKSILIHFSKKKYQINFTIFLFNFLKEYVISYEYSFCNFEANTCQFIFSKIKIVTRERIIYIYI